MAAIVEAYRYAFFGVGSLNLHYHLLSGGITLAVLLSGVLFSIKLKELL